MPATRMRLLGAMIALACTAGDARAQVGRIALKPANGTHPEEFTLVGSLRELADGRVLVTDTREQRLVVLDFGSGASRPVGRAGRGPNEYGRLTPLRPIGGDSTLLPDIMARRYLILHRDSIVRTVPPDDPATMLIQGFILGADDRGNFYFEVSPDRATGRTLTGASDSNRVTLVSRRTARMDTVASILNVPRRIEIARNAANEITSSLSMVAGPMRTGEQALLFPDGWLAVARLNPFRVDWRSPDGAWTKGAALPVPPIRVDAREIAAYDARQAANAAANPAPAPPPGMNLDVGRDFPPFMPPFVLGGLSRGPLGTLILRRAKSADLPDNHYLVVDRRGRLIGQIDLPATETIVGAGERTLYIAVRDEDDILRLRRHPW